MDSDAQRLRSSASTAYARATTRKEKFRPGLIQCDVSTPVGAVQSELYA
jgi:hypothetical protein